MKGDSRRWEKLDDEEISHLMLAPNKAARSDCKPDLNHLIKAKFSFADRRVSSHFCFQLTVA